jgi:hypothetical protein
MIPAPSVIAEIVQIRAPAKCADVLRAASL